jgi:molybdate transport system regulatory protein
MKLSARNQFAGTVKNVVKGPVSAEITVTVAPNIDIVAVISSSSAQSLGLSAGKSAYVVIKASSVMVGVE